MKKSIKILLTVSVVLIVAVVLAACTSGSKNPEGVLYVLPERGVDHMEFTTGKKLLEDNNIKVTLASTIVGEISDDMNEKFQSSILIKNVDVDDYELIAIMGGEGMKLIEKNEDVMKLLQSADKKGKYIGAICYGPVLLARSGILKDKEATVYPNKRNKKLLTDNGALVKDDNLVVSENIFTGMGPQDSQIFAEKMLELVK